MAELTLFLCGDVMTGRGVDQVLPHPGDPVLYEAWMRSAEDYVTLTERATGPIPRPVRLDWIWGDALPVMAEADARVVNLETAVTTHGVPWPDKGIHYRMNPANLGCLTVARLDGCVLANNHVLDWERPGLLQTLETLHRAGLRTAGAGHDRGEAEAPAVIEVEGRGRVLVFAVAHPSSGVPLDWAADEGPGVAVVESLTEGAVREIAARVSRHRRETDLVVLSIHWGGNWGWRIPDAHRRFARALVDEAQVDLVHGHSSHHPLGIELHRGRPILYGCGDFLNDYEGITGYEAMRPELTFGYLATFAPRSGALIRLELVPMRIRHLRLERASPEDTAWLAAMMARECGRLGAEVRPGPDGRLVVGAGGLVGS